MVQALLLLGDMADLRSMKKHEMFLSLKRDLELVSVFIIVFSYYLFIYIYLYFTLKVLIVFFYHNILSLKAV